MKLSNLSDMEYLMKAVEEHATLRGILRNAREGLWIGTDFDSVKVDAGTAEHAVMRSWVETRLQSVEEKLRAAGIEIDVPRDVEQTDEEE